MTVDILGTPYEIIVKTYDEEEAFERSRIVGYCDEYMKEIVVCDMKTHKRWQYESKKAIVDCQKATLRHEIVHAFLNESGLTDSSNVLDFGWARNEEMVDWFALQGEKIYKAWEKVGVLR